MGHIYPQNLLVSNQRLGQSFRIGPTPCQREDTVFELEKFQAVLNVSDEPGLTFSKPNSNTQYIWYPIIETFEWPVATLYAIFKTLDYFQEQSISCYVHCIGGSCRAPTITALWHELRAQRDPLKHSYVRDALAKGQLTVEMLEILKTANGPIEGHIGHKHTSWFLSKLPKCAG